MTQDPEIKAMSDVATALAGLDQDAIRRIIEWAADRYHVRSVPDRTLGTPDVPDREDPTEPPQPDPRLYDDFAALFDAADPQTSIDKALVAAYWYQVVNGSDDIDSYSLNKELKHLGHPSTNITRDLEALINKKPRLMMQVRKSGNTKQARKRYKITVEGIRAVEKMLGNGNSKE